MIFIAASVAGAVGAACRYLVTGWVQRRVQFDFPTGTLIVNLAGSFALGLGVGVGGLESSAGLAALGFFGGFTTFSTWMVETIGLGSTSRRALLYLFLSLVGGVIFAVAGFNLAD